MISQSVTLAWLTQHSGSLVTTFLLSLAFFRLFVRPAVGTAFDDSDLFIFTGAACAHLDGCNWVCPCRTRHRPHRFLPFPQCAFVYG